MPLSVTCACGKKYTFKDEFAGRRAKCPACGQVVQIPGQRASAAQPPKPDSQQETSPQWNRRNLIYTGVGVGALVVAIGIGLMVYVLVFRTPRQAIITTPPDAASVAPVPQSASVGHPSSSAPAAPSPTNQAKQPVSVPSPVVPEQQAPWLVTQACIGKQYGYWKNTSSYEENLGAARGSVSASEGEELVCVRFCLTAQAKDDSAIANLTRRRQELSKTVPFFGDLLLVEAKDLTTLNSAYRMLDLEGIELVFLPDNRARKPRWVIEPAVDGYFVPGELKLGGLLVTSGGLATCKPPLYHAMRTSSSFTALLEVGRPATLAVLFSVPKGTNLAETRLKVFDQSAVPLALVDNTYEVPKAEKATVPNPPKPPETKIFQGPEPVFTGKTALLGITAQTIGKSGITVREGNLLLWKFLQKPLVVWVEDAGGKTARETNLTLSAKDLEVIRQNLANSEECSFEGAVGVWTGFRNVHVPATARHGPPGKVLDATSLVPPVRIDLFVNDADGMLLVGPVNRNAIRFVGRVVSPEK